MIDKDVGKMSIRFFNRKRYVNRLRYNKTMYHLGASVSLLWTDLQKHAFVYLTSKIVA